MIRRAHNIRLAYFVAAALIGSIVLFFAPAAYAGRVCTADEAPFDIKAGTVTVSHVSDSRMKVGIQKMDTQEIQYYDCLSGEVAQYPLTMGNGTYTVFVYENITGDLYGQADSLVVNLQLEDENAAFCSSIREIQWEPASALADKAAELVAGKSGTRKKAMAIYNYIAANYSYDDAVVEEVLGGDRGCYVPVPEKIFTGGKGTCYDLASLYAAMCRSVGIPCKLVKGDAGGLYHAWNSIYDEESDEWVELDVTHVLGSIRFFPESYDRIDASKYTAQRYC